MGSGLRWQLRCKIYICGEAAQGANPEPKFESRDEWPGIRDWILDLNQAVIEIAQMVRWPFCKRDLSATLEMTTARSAIKAPRRFIIFMRRTNTPHS